MTRQMRPQYLYPVLIGAIVVNLIGAGVQQWLMHETKTRIDEVRFMQAQNELVAEELRKRAAALPPHACGSTILPGETCNQTFILKQRSGGL